MPATHHLAIEGAIARAHRSLSAARDLSSTLSDLGLHDDLQMMLIEVERLQLDLLKGSKRSRSFTPRHRVSQTHKEP